jgi:hypothetical protein
MLINEILDFMADFLPFLKQFLKCMASNNSLDGCQSQLAHGSMDVRHIVDTFSWSNNPVVACGIDAHQDVVFRHHPLPRTIYQLDLAIHLPQSVRARIHVNQTRLNYNNNHPQHPFRTCFDVDSETFLHSYPTLIYLMVWVLDTADEAR